MTLDHLREKLLVARGYREVVGGDNLAPGDFFIIKDELGHWQLHVRFIRSRYPHTLMGITSTGRIVMANLYGDKTKGLGYTIEEARDRVRKDVEKSGEKLMALHLLANSGQTVKIVNGELAPAMPNQRPEQTALVLITKKQKSIDGNVYYQSLDVGKRADLRSLLARLQYRAFRNQLNPAVPYFNESRLAENWKDLFEKRNPWFDSSSIPTDISLARSADFIRNLIDFGYRHSS
jgi:hypothetical protein